MHHLHLFIHNEFSVDTHEHLHSHTFTTRAFPNALHWIRLWWVMVWLHPKSTKAWCVLPYTACTLYTHWHTLCSCLMGKASSTSGIQTIVHTFIRKQSSWKCLAFLLHLQTCLGFPLVLMDMKVSTCVGKEEVDKDISSEREEEGKAGRKLGLGACFADCGLVVPDSFPCSCWELTNKLLRDHQLNYLFPILFHCH